MPSLMKNAVLISCIAVGVVVLLIHILSSGQNAGIDSTASGKEEKKQEQAFSDAPFPEVDSHSSEALADLGVPPIEKSKTDKQASAEAFFEKQNARIIEDDFGNHFVDISVKGYEAKEYIISEFPIFYPSEEQLNFGVEGCGVGGFYVDVMATLTLVVKDKKQDSVYHYQCSFDGTSQSYILVDAEPSYSVDDTLSELMVRIQ